LNDGYLAFLAFTRDIPVSPLSTQTVDIRQRPAVSYSVAARPVRGCKAARRETTKVYRNASLRHFPKPDVKSYAQSFALDYSLPYGCRLLRHMWEQRRRKSNFTRQQARCSHISAGLWSNYGLLNSNFHIGQRIGSHREREYFSSRWQPWCCRRRRLARAVGGHKMGCTRSADRPLRLEVPHLWTDKCCRWCQNWLSAGGPI